LTLVSRNPDEKDANVNSAPPPLLRLWRATVNSRNGLIFAVRSERAIREELAALMLAIPFAWLVGASMMRRVELVCAVALVLVVELLNTAIEKLADRLTTDRDQQIKHVKDMGSAAVGVALLMAGAFWLFAIAERIGAI
jgi:diacylglycerol kinase (ATP)